jgi:hypothetical protein
LTFSVSIVVRNKIMQQQHANILSCWGMVDLSEFHAMGSQVEDLFVANLCLKNTVTMMRRQQLKLCMADADIAEDDYVVSNDRFFVVA